MNRYKLFLILLAVQFLGFTACSFGTTQWYGGQGKPANETAIIESGPYTNIEAIDGKAVTGLKIAVLPGTYQVSIKPVNPISSP